MKVIELKEKAGRVIRFERIKPFKNICKVTGVSELVNVVTEYKVGGGVIKLLISWSIASSSTVRLTSLLKISPRLCTMR